MRAPSHMIATGFAAVAVLSAVALPAHAACTRLGFSVNDYGKEGPIKDAKALLDKYVAKWAADRNIAKYRTGPKSVNCELFLDVIVFDEHTCRAEATVCWDGPALAKPQSAAGGDAVQPEAKPAAKVPKAAKADDAGTGAVKRAETPAGAIKIKPAKIETGTLPAAAPAAAKPAAAPVVAPVAAPVVATPKPVAAPAPANDAVVPAAAPAASPANPAADQAVMAAEKAAAAAERAALAAERAAAAAAKMEATPAAKP